MARETKTLKKEKQPKAKIGFFTKVAMVVFLLFCGITIFQMSTQIASSRREIAAAEKQIAAYQAEIAALEEELQTPVDYTYVRKIAKSKLNYSMPDDIIYFNDLSN